MKSTDGITHVNSLKEMASDKIGEGNLKEETKPLKDIKYTFNDKNHQYTDQARQFVKDMKEKHPIFGHGASSSSDGDHPRTLVEDPSPDKPIHGFGGEGYQLLKRWDTAWRESNQIKQYGGYGFLSDKERRDYKSKSGEIVEAGKRFIGRYLKWHNKNAEKAKNAANGLEGAASKLEELVKNCKDPIKLELDSLSPRESFDCSSTKISPKIKLHTEIKEERNECMKIYEEMNSKYTELIDKFNSLETGVDRSHKTYNVTLQDYKNLYATYEQKFLGVVFAETFNQLESIKDLKNMNRQEEFKKLSRTINFYAKSFKHHQEQYKFEKQNIQQALAQPNVRFNGPRLTVQEVKKYIASADSPFRMGSARVDVLQSSITKASEHENPDVQIITSALERDPVNVLEESYSYIKIAHMYLERIKSSLST